MPYNIPGKPNILGGIPNVMFGKPNVSYVIPKKINGIRRIGIPVSFSVTS